MTSEGGGEGMTSVEEGIQDQCGEGEGKRRAWRGWDHQFHSFI